MRDASDRATLGWSEATTNTKNKAPTTASAICSAPHPIGRPLHLVERKEIPPRERPFHACYKPRKPPFMGAPCETPHVTIPFLKFAITRYRDKTTQSEGEICPRAERSPW